MSRRTFGPKRPNPFHYPRGKCPPRPAKTKRYRAYVTWCGLSKEKVKQRHFRRKRRND